MGSVVAFEQLADLRDQLRANGSRIVLTNGHFDLLHTGHLRYLRLASTTGDCLIVGVNNDVTTTARKGPRRPIFPEKERAELIASLACVDYAVIFREETAHRLIEILKPDVYVKGGDYTIDPNEPGTPLPEASAVQEYGGKVQILVLESGQSTSAIEQRIIDRWRLYGTDS
ncbi:MAG: adenylyltransferase/cytidyltransferase family protein, partial [Thermomicrobiaceae bacterium]